MNVHGLIGQAFASRPRAEQPRRRARVVPAAHLHLPSAATVPSHYPACGPRDALSAARGRSGYRAGLPFPPWPRAPEHTKRIRRTR